MSPRSSFTDFPTTPGAFGPTWQGFNDGFVTRLDLLPTGVSKYGASTPSCQGPIAIGVTQMPQAGGMGFQATSTNGPPDAIGMLLVGAQPDASGTTIAGVTLHVALSHPLVALSVTSNSVGYARRIIAIPAAALGGRAYVQFLWRNTPSCGGSGSYSASNALAITPQP